MAGLLDGFGAALVLLIVGFVAARRRLLVHEALDREVERHYRIRAELFKFELARKFRQK